MFKSFRCSVLRRVVNGMICLGIEFVVVAHDETPSILAPHPRVNMKYRYQTLVTGFYHLDFSTINTYLQPFNFSKIVNI